MKSAVSGITGISYVEVREARPLTWTLCVHLAADPDVTLEGLVGPANFTARWVDVTPGTLVVLNVDFDSALPDAVILQLASELPPMQTAVRMEVSLIGLPGLNPERASLQFSVRTTGEVPLPIDDADLAAPPIEIDYLSKDYASFRQTFFDTLAQRIPAWTERHAADELVAIAEVLAYASDYLSAYQDAVGTEAYLTTARLRTSVRRHARLLDYHLFEGCASRVFVGFEVNEDPVEIAAGMAVTGALNDVRARGPYLYARDVQQNAQIFETLEGATLWVALNTIEIAVDGDKPMQVFPAGSTRATLRGRLTHLAAGALLVFEQSGTPRRHPVRLSQDPTFATDAAGRETTIVTWFGADATPYDFLVTARDSAGGTRTDVTVVRGNVVAAQQGTLLRDDVAFVPDAPLRLRTNGMLCSVPYDPVRARSAPAAEILSVDASQALPNIEMYGVEPGRTYEQTWTARRDLLDSGPFARHFVAEIESDRSVTLRFGDGVHGRRPIPGTTFRIAYRVGSLDGANVAYDVLRAIVLEDETGEDLRITKVYNPVSARGGEEPEDLEVARRNAPESFRTQERCVIADDFLDVMRADARVANAVTVPWWSGSERVTLVYVQPKSRDENMSALIADLERRLEPMLIAGEFAAVRAPIAVPLFLRMLITADPARSTGTVVKNVYDALERTIAQSAFTFGTDVYASPLIAAAMSADGVLDARISALVRYNQQAYPVANTVVEIGPHEIARLDNDRLRPQNGTIIVDTLTQVVA
jgi:hypothetical protein